VLSPKGLPSPVQYKIYHLAIKICKTSLVHSTVQYILDNGGEHYDVSKAFLRTEMVKAM